ncbi:MAG: pilus assembly protein [Actinomycetota bacterium]|nr:pilus assembly protein [Actinomycetota bacterium]
MLRLSDQLRQDRGTAMVEFAIVLPVLLLIILGILYFGRYENYSSQETQLVEQGVRWAALNTNPGTGSGQTLQQYIVAQAQPELRNGSNDVTQSARIWIYQPTGATYQIGQPIRVCITAVVNFPSPMGTPTATMAQSATMRIEQLASGGYPYTAGNYSGQSTPPSQCPTT